MMDAFNPKIPKNARKFAIRIFASCLSAHLGTVLGNEAYFWAFNSWHSVLTSYVAEWLPRLLHALDPRRAIYSLEFAVDCHNAPGMTALLIGIAIAIGITAMSHKWTWLYVSVFISFAALQFFIGLVWKT